MKLTCLSVRQPWASLILYGPKWCENRTWDSSYRGELWIHASSWDEGFEEAQDDLPVPVPTGVLLGRVNLLGIHDVEQLEIAGEGWQPDDADCQTHLQQLSRDPLNFFGWGHVSGPKCWLLSDRRPLQTPIPMPGKLRLWTAEVEPDQLALIERK